MKHLLLFIVGLAILFGQDLHAQVRVQIHEDDTQGKKIVSAIQKARTSIIIIDPPDVKRLKDEDASDPGPFRFGKELDVDFSLSDGNWVNEDSVRVWTLSLKSPGAFSVSLYFDLFRLAAGAKLYITDEGQRMIIGPIDNQSIGTIGDFRTDLVNGNQLYVTIREPIFGLESSEIHISKMVYGYRSLSNYVGFGDSAPCHINVNCQQGVNWQNQANAV